MNYSTTLKISDSKNKLIQNISEFKDITFFSAWGNRGDDLIYAGTKNLLKGLKYKEIYLPSFKNETGELALISGSGGWSKHFNVLPTYILKIEKQFQKIIVLPSTYICEENNIKEILSSVKAKFYARELVSYYHIKDICDSDIAYDCAFYYDFEKYIRSGMGILNAFRTDSASLWASLPHDNNDISIICSNLHDWLKTIASYEFIRTDRAHVMIAGAMLGKKVEYTATIDHKLPAIAEYSLKDFPVVQVNNPMNTRILNHKYFVISKQTNFVTPSYLIDPKIIEFSEFVSEKYKSSLKIFGDLQSLIDYEPISKSVVIVADGAKELTKYPDKRNLFSNVLEKYEKIIFVDSIDSFEDINKLRSKLIKQNLHPEFLGYVKNFYHNNKLITIFSKQSVNVQSKNIKDFTVVAIIAAYNEEDIIDNVLTHFINNDVKIYVIDNWSTDTTYEIVKRKIGKGVIGLERWPRPSANQTYDHKGLLHRKEELAEELDADWYIHTDADEIRESPWRELNLKEAIYKVNHEGYNAIDFTVLNFQPIDDNYSQKDSPIDYFQYFNFGDNSGSFSQIKAWKNTHNVIDLVSSGGHNVSFEDKKVYPWKFLLRHYPIRSQRHGEKKIINERITRFQHNELKVGWHSHYDLKRQKKNFIKNPNGLMKFSESFYDDFLIERLSGIGIPRIDGFPFQNSLSEIKLLGEIQRMKETINSLDNLIKKINRSKIILRFYKIQQVIDAKNLLNQFPLNMFFNKENSFPGKISKFFSNKNLKRDKVILDSSNLFDLSWYLENNPDILKMEIDPVEHFLIKGGFEGRDPSQYFSCIRYLEMYPDVVLFGINPLIHYLRWGKKEGRKIFDSYQDTGIG